MDRMRVNRVSRVGRVAMAAGDPAHTILTIGRVNVDDALFTTAAPHGLAGSEDIVVSGASVAGYNGGVTLLSAPTSTTFVVAAAYTSDSTGGTWRLA